MEGEQKQQLHRGAGPGSLPRAAAARSSAGGGGSPRSRRGRRCSLLPSPPWRGLPWAGARRRLRAGMRDAVSPVPFPLLDRSAASALRQPDARPSRVTRIRNAAMLNERE